VEREPSHLKQFIARWRPPIDAALEAGLDALPAAEETRRAMAHMLLAPGKRLRPILGLLAARAVDPEVELDRLVPVMAAIEAVHTFTLVHDDLPAMDDAPTRRGLPTLHILYDEATALLIGDAIFNLAFHLLAKALAELSRPDLAAPVLLRLTRATHLVVEGQLMDLALEGKPVGEKEVTRIHELKTASLFEATLAIGGLVGGGSEEQVEALARYGYELGLAFQARDDLLSVEGVEVVVGKPLASDRERLKPTLIKACGVERTRELAELHRREAVGALAGLPGPTEELCELARLAVERNR